MIDVQFQIAVPEDAETLTQISVASKAHWGYPAEWLTKWADALRISPNYITEHFTLKAIVDGQAAGYYSLIPLDGSAWLDNLFIHPDFMGQGVGRALFEHAVAKCRVLGKTRMEWESDPNAAEFYGHMGAHRIGEKAADYGRSLPVFAIEVKLED